VGSREVKERGKKEAGGRGGEGEGRGEWRNRWDVV